MDQAELEAVIERSAPAELRRLLSMLPKLVGKRQAPHVAKLLAKVGAQLADEKTARRESPQGGPDGPSG